jgi:general secretion pathway protein A
MQVAGSVHNPFRKSALKALFHRSRGVPRLINIIADRALVGAFAGEYREINAKLVHAAANEVQLGEPGARRGPWRWYAAAVAGLLLALLTWAMIRPADVVPVPEPAIINESLEPVAMEALPGPESAVTGEAGSPGEITEIPLALDEDWLGIQNQAAWQGMATLWNEPSASESIRRACEAEDGGDWACLHGDGSLSRIRQLGLPVLLQLHSGDPGLLLLQGIDGKRLLAGAPGTERTVARQAVEDRWFGAYMVAWPQASSWPREIARGDEGAAVATVLKLAGMADRPYTGEAVFDSNFEAWLIEFQSRFGLEADGIVGPRTLLYLVRPSINEPELQTDWQEDR